MQGAWLAAPVSLFFRRVVNVLSSLSLAHHAIRPVDDTGSSKSSVDLFSLPSTSPEGEAASPSDNPLPSHLSRRQTNPSPPRDPDSPKPEPPDTRQDIIHLLMRSPVLYDPLRTPRHPIVLCHGLYGFDVRGPAAIPSLRMHYWADVRSFLKHTVHADVLVSSVPSTGSIASRAEHLDRFLREAAGGRGVNLLAHSMGGLDGRHLISTIKPEEYVPLSLTTIATPHRGSPFMDWCTDYLGLGRTGEEEEKRRLAKRAAKEEGIDESVEYLRVDAEVPGASPSSSSATSTLSSLSSLPSSFTARLLSLFDSPAYANLTSSYLRDVFNPSTPDDPNVRYWSVGARSHQMSVWHPLWFPKLVVDGVEERERERAGDQGGEWGNDGLVTLRSARWGEYLGTIEGADHWRVRGEAGTQLGAELGAQLQVDRLVSRVARALGRTDGPDSIEKKVARKVDSAKGREGDVNANINATANTREEGKEEREGREEALRSSTARLSAVVDWLVEQVPAAQAVTREPEQSKEKGREKEKERGARKGDLDTDADLERFYVALARRMWDEGL